MSIFERIWTIFRQEKTVANLVPSWAEGQPTYPTVNFENLVRYGWRKNELIYACVNRKASTASQVHLMVLGENGEEDFNHPLAKLIHSPNPYMTESDFWKAIIIYQHLAGRAIFEKERNRSGKVVRLWPLRPDWVQVIPSSESVVRGYRYAVPGMEAKDLDARDVVDFRLFDPLDSYHGWPPVAVAARVGDVDNAATDFVKLFWEKGGMPAYYIKTKQKLTETTASELQARWAAKYGGSEKWVKPAVLDQDADVMRVGNSFEEMAFSDLDARSESRICAVLGVPPIIVNAKVGLDRSTFSNYKEARSSWWQDVLIPIYEDLLDTLENQLASEFGEVKLRWDYDAVPALQDDRTAVWNRAIEAFRSSLITRNEFRRIVGLSDLGPRGEMYVLSVAQVEIGIGGSKEMNMEMEKKAFERPSVEGDFEEALRKYFKGLDGRIRKRLEKDYGGFMG